MKNLIKDNIFYIILAVLIISSFVIIYTTFYNPNKIVEKGEVVLNTKNEKLIEIINENINFDKELLPNSLKINNDNSLSSLITQALNDTNNNDNNKITVDNVDSKDNSLANAIDNKVEEIKDNKLHNIKMISSDKFDCEYNGKAHSFRLIGVKADGNVEKVKELLENVKDVNIEYDNIKVNNEGREVIYLWDGEAAEDKSNLINLQIILQKYATTTYASTSDMTSEVPNNKYATAFIKYQKYVNK